MTLVERVANELNRAHARYVVVGGVAVVLHGQPRFTADLDLVLDMEPASLKRAMQALMDLGLRARLPVDPMQFADPEVRTRWAEEKNMLVFSLLDPKNPMNVVDLFVESPVPFDELWERAIDMTSGSIAIKTVAIADLIEMKRKAGRPQDLLDVEKLEKIRKLTIHD